MAINTVGSSLERHPIFSLPKNLDAKFAQSLELSSTNLGRDLSTSPLAGRHNITVVRDGDLIVAVGSEIRITPLADTRNASAAKGYKILNTPNIHFSIRSLVLNPSRKLLAVVGKSEVVIVVLPRKGYTRTVPETLECKSLNIGGLYHGPRAAPIAKVDWHPWGESGSSLLIMTVDGVLREYDLSLDPEEPQQTVSFFPKKASFKADNYEASSFTYGKGTADWGPLTIYTVTRSGDIFSVCPFLPTRACVPILYVHSLESFVSAKREFLAQSEGNAALDELSSVYDYQQKYISALLRQITNNTASSGSHTVVLHPPTTLKSSPSKQGPFLFQPAPLQLSKSEGGDATDILYSSYDNGLLDEGQAGLGVIFVVFQDGRVDFCLDVDKIEARWDRKRSSPDLPMLAVYETIDLGLVHLNSHAADREFEPISDLLSGNHPVLFADTGRDNTIYIYHAFGVHALYVGDVLRSIVDALSADEEDESSSALHGALSKSTESTVFNLLSTFSAERRCSNPVIGVALSESSIYVISSAMRVTMIPFSATETEISASPLPSTSPSISKKTPLLIGASPNTPAATSSPGTPPAYVSSLGAMPFKTPDVLTRPSGLPANPRLSVPASSSSGEFMLTADSLRYLGKMISMLTTQIRGTHLAYQSCETRVRMQMVELKRICETCLTLKRRVDHLKTVRREATENRLKLVQDKQEALLGQLERMMHAAMQKANPVISEYESKWFEELKRMRAEVGGLGQFNAGSLAVRTRTLEQEYERLMPTLKEAVETLRARTKVEGRHENLGASQAFELGQHSITEKTRIARLEQEIVSLAEKLDINVGRPPSDDRVTESTSL